MGVDTVGSVRWVFWACVAFSAAVLIAVLVMLTSSQVLAQGDPVEVSAGNVSQLINEINNANSRTVPTIITLTASEYVLTAADNRDNGFPVIIGDITVEGDGATIRRDSVASFRIFQVASDATLNLHDGTISGGSVIDQYLIDGMVRGEGGGIYNEGGELSLINSTVTGNTASDSGGGIYNEGGELSLINSTVTGNSAKRYGGGLMVQGQNEAQVTISNSVVSGNTADENGGGIYARPRSLDIIGSRISNNRADGYGGGIYVYLATESVSLTNSTISGNIAAISGGGIHVALLAMYLPGLPIVSSGATRQSLTRIFGPVL